MRKSLLTIFILLVALGIATPTVMADHDDHGHGKLAASTHRTVARPRANF